MGYMYGERKMKRIGIIFKLIVISGIITSLSPLLVPLAIGEDGSLNVLGYVSGIMFWVGLFSGLLGMYLMKKFWKNRAKDEQNDKKKKVALRFGSNPHAKIADSIMLVGLGGVLLSLVYRTINEWIVVICLTLMIAGSYGHFLLNSEMYAAFSKHKNSISKFEKGEK